MSQPPFDVSNQSHYGQPQAPASHPGVNGPPNPQNRPRRSQYDWGPLEEDHQEQMPLAPAPPQAPAQPMIHRRPHSETHPGSGVWQPIPIRVNRSNGQVASFSAATDLPWIDFHSRCSAKLDRPAELTSLCVNHSRSKTTARTVLLNDEDFAQFMREVAQMASTARSVPVTVDVWGSNIGDPEPQMPPSKGKKRSRVDDIPPRELNKEDEESADLFNRIKNRLVCEQHSRGGNDVYCVVDHNRGKKDKHTQLDKMARTRVRAESSDDKDPPTNAPPVTNSLSLDYDLDFDELDSDFEDEDEDGWNLVNALSSTGNQGNSLALATSTPGAGPSTLTQPPQARPSSLFDLMPNVVPTRILSIYMSIPDALDALNAAKPNHNFPDLAEAFQSAGFEYVDEILGMTAQRLAEEVDGLTLPAARAIQTFARAQIQYQAVLE